MANYFYHSAGGKYANTTSSGASWSSCPLPIKMNFTQAELQNRPISGSLNPSINNELANLLESGYYIVGDYIGLAVVPEKHILDDVCHINYGKLADTVNGTTGVVTPSLWTKDGGYDDVFNAQRRPFATEASSAGFTYKVTAKFIRCADCVECATQPDFTVVSQSDATTIYGAATLPTFPTRWNAVDASADIDANVLQTTYFVPSGLWLSLGLEIVALPTYVGSTTKKLSLLPSVSKVGYHARNVSFIDLTG